MMSPNVTNNVTNKKQLGGMVENKTNYMSNLSNAVDSKMMVPELNMPKVLIDITTRD